VRGLRETYGKSLWKVKGGKRLTTYDAYRSKMIGTMKENKFRKVHGVGERGKTRTRQEGVQEQAKGADPE